MELWRPKHYRRKDSISVPLTFLCKHASAVFTVQYLLKGEVSDAFQIVQAAAENSINVGIDEYDEERFNCIMDRSEAFSVKERGSDRLAGLILIHPCLYCVSADQCLGFFEIFLPSKSDVRNLLSNLVAVATRITQEMECYLGVVTSVFTVHTDWLREVLKQQFAVTACLPFSGNLLNIPDVDAYLLYKKFSYPDAVSIKLPTLQDCRIIAEQMCKSLPDPEMDNERLLQMPSLPKRVKLGHSGLETIWRQAMPSDGRMLYDVSMEAADQGKGLTRDEFPTYKFFYHFWFKTLHGIVIEEAHTSKFIAYVGYGDFDPSRCLEPKVCGSMAIIQKEHRNTGIGFDIAKQVHPMVRELGYMGILSEAYMANLPMQELLRKLGFIRVGVMPFCANLGQLGFTELVYSFFSLENEVTANDKEMKGRKLSKL